MRATPEVAYALSARFAQGALMLGAAAAMVWRVAPAEQGFLWTFFSMAALQQIGELGLVQVVLQTANHYAARSEGARLAGFWRRARTLASVLFPVFIATAMLVRSRAAFLTVCAVFLPFLILFFAQFARWKQVL